MGRNPLLDVLSPQPSRQPPSKGNFGGLGDIMVLVTQAEIAKLLTSGEMTREQFQELKENAKFILKFLK